MFASAIVLTQLRRNDNTISDGEANYSSAKRLAINALWSADTAILLQGPTPVKLWSCMDPMIHSFVAWMTEYSYTGSSLISRAIWLERGLMETLYGIGYLTAIYEKFIIIVQDENVPEQPSCSKRLIYLVCGLTLRIEWLDIKTR
jgi:hypothetical protein